MARRAHKPRLGRVRRLGQQALYFIAQMRQRHRLCEICREARSESIWPVVNRSDWSARRISQDWEEFAGLDGKRWTSSRRCASVTGFARYAVKPAARAFSRSPCMALAVSAMIGKVVYRGPGVTHAALCIRCGLAFTNQAGLNRDFPHELFQWPRRHRLPRRLHSRSFPGPFARARGW